MAMLQMHRKEMNKNKNKSTEKYTGLSKKPEHFQIAIMRKLAEVFACPRCHFKEG